MQRSLVDAALRDALRVWRRRLLAGRRRRLGLAAAGVLVAAAGVVAGHAAADLLGPALAGATARSAVVVGLVVPSLAAGVAVGAALPAPGVALGERLVVAAVSPLDRAAAALAPILPAAVVAGVVASPVLVPLVSAGPAGPLALLPLGAIALTAVGVGGAIAACLRTPGALTRGAAVPALGCLVSATSLRAPVSGELLGSPRAAVAAALLAVPAALVALVGWGLVHAAVPTRGAGADGRSRLPRRAAPAVLVAALRLVARRRDVRVSLAGATLVGCVGAGAARLVTGPAPGVGPLAVITASAAAAPAGLVLGEALRAAAHVWALAPARPLVVGAWLGAGALVGLAPPVLVALVGALLWGPTAALGTVAALAVGMWLLAVLAGGLTALAVTGASGQAASLGLYAVLCGVLSALLAVVGPRLDALAVPGPLAGGVLLAALALAATQALGAATVGGR